MKSEKKKILITGGNGFIAKNLCEQIGNEYALSAPGSMELNVLDTSKVSDFLEKERFDIVIHAANYDAAHLHYSKDPSKVLEYNLKMFFNITRCRNYFGRMIYFGSAAEFGREHWIPRMNEGFFDRHVPEDQYGFSKYIMNKFARENGDIVNLRLFGVFGKYEDWRVRFISNVCCRAALNLPIVINQNRVFDFLYVDDLVGIVKRFIDKKPGRSEYNVCTGKTYDFMTIAQKVLEVSGKNLEIIFRNPALGREYSGDNSVLVSEFGQIDFTSMDFSIQALYGWFEDNIESIRASGYVG